MSDPTDIRRRRSDRSAPAGGPARALRALRASDQRAGVAPGERLPPRLAPAPLGVLVVAADADFAAVQAMLGGAGAGRFRIERCRAFEAGRRVIGERRHDVYLIGSRLGARSGLELVAEAFTARPPAPVILLAAAAELEPELDAAALGIAERLVLSELDGRGLRRAIRYALAQHRAAAELERSEQRYALAVRAANDGIWDWDLTAGTIRFSPRWHAILGRAAGAGGTGPGEPVDRDPETWFGLVHPGDELRLRAAVQAHLDGRAPQLACEHRMRHADGSWRWVVTRGLVLRGADGVPTRMAGSLSDVTDRRVAQLRLQHDALHDDLTGLPNRTLFMDRVHQHLLRGARGAGCAVLFFDVDRFKLVNDSLGHAIGDKLLVALATRVAGALRPSDTVARLGGDEFALLIEDVDGAEAATRVAERVRRALDRPFGIEGHELFAGVSIGVAVAEPGLDAAGLIANADIAMYAAKRRGRGRSALFDEAMRRRAVDRLARENELRQVVEGSLLAIHYQPIVELASGRIRGLEALARWPQGRGAVAPSEFIPIAEETGIIGVLGQQVLRTALAALARWRRAGLVGDDVCMSVNLSGRQLDDPALADQVQAAIAAAGLPPAALKLEITESTLIDELERTRRVFADVCAGGIGLHLDDFGTGYSSLAALHHLPVDALKIDRSFVAAIAEPRAGNDVIIRSTVAMAHSLGLPVIAEGIEHPDQLRRLHALGCEFGQGHLFSRALSAADTEALLTRWRAGEVTALVAAA